MKILCFLLFFGILSAQSLPEEILVLHEETRIMKDTQDQTIQKEGRATARRIYTSLWLNEHNNPSYYYLLSRLTDLNESIKLNEQALKIFSGFTWSYLMLGVCAELKNPPDLKTAEAYYKKSLELKCDFFEAHENLGRLYFNEKKYYDSLFHIEKMIEINPGYCKAWLTKGNILMILKEYSEAIACYERAGEDKKTNTDSYISRCYYESGDYEQALRYSEKSRVEFKDNSAYLMNARCLYKLKKYDDSIAAYKKMYDLSGDDAVILRETGSCYFALEDFKQAKFYFEQALRQDPFDPNTHYMLGLVYMRNRDYNLAEYHLKSTCVLDKTNDIAAMKLKIVQELLSEQKTAQ